MQPACRQLGNQRLDTAFSHLGDIGVAACTPRWVIGYRCRIDQYQTLKALQLPSNDLEGEIAAEREPDQREVRGRICEQHFRHPSQRIVVAECKHRAPVVSLERGDLRSVQPLVRQMGASESEERPLKHTSIVTQRRKIARSFDIRSTRATRSPSEFA